MNSRQLILLSSYRVPAKDSLMIGEEDAACFLNAYLALWHPLLLRGALEPPKIASPYDHENPTADHVYALPESPPIFLPDDWDQRVLDAGSLSFQASANRSDTLVSLMDALSKTSVVSGPSSGDSNEQRTTDNEQRTTDNEQRTTDNEQRTTDNEQRTTNNEQRTTDKAFTAIGFGYIHLMALFEAMDHENLLSSSDFWIDVQQAVEAYFRNDDEACRRSLQSAADRLMTAREGLYPVAIHVVDICLLEDRLPDKPLPAALEKNAPLNLVASGKALESLKNSAPDQLALLRERVEAGTAEVCVGAYEEREDLLLSIESQAWNLLKGLQAAREVLGRDVRVFGRKQFGAHSQLPMLLNSCGLERALLLSFDESSMPSHRATVVGWPTPDGRQIDAFTRVPYKADSAQTYFHLAHYLHQTIAQDSSATLALLHRDMPAGPWYEDWLELNRFAPVLGKWTTLTGYFGEVMAGETMSSSSADEFVADCLTERTEKRRQQPVSWFAHHARMRRRLDTVWTLAAMVRGLAGRNDRFQLEGRMRDLEDRVESGVDVVQDLDAMQNELCNSMAERLLSKATSNTPGFLVLNPCSFARRVVLEAEGVSGSPAISGPLKACQVDGGKARMVVEVPSLGFAWVPRAGLAEAAPKTPRMKLADDRHVRNEFFEAEIDPKTGGLRGLWDQRTRVNRMGQQLVYKPGSTMLATSIKTTSTGPALGELISEGTLRDEHDKVLAKFRQRFRAWLGRPVLEMHIEIFPEHEPVGYPWHAYYGARFAWRDERARLLRGIDSAGLPSSHTRPNSPDYIEWRVGRQNTVLFTGGLPFQQRHDARMLDVVLVPEGETCRTFDLALALDREHPMQTALGIITPVPWIPVEKGPPHVGASGWLFHLDAPNLLLHGMRPAADGADAITARMLECVGHAGQAELRCVRNPKRAVLLDARGELLSDAMLNGDAATFDVTPGSFFQLKVEFGEY